MRFACLFAVALLVGCGRPAAVTDADKASQDRVENFAKNTSLIIGGYRSAFIDEAKSHIETKRAWSVEKIAEQIRAGKLADGSPVTPEAIAAGFEDVYAKRDAAVLQIAEKVAAATETEQTARKDLDNARKLWAQVRAYDETPGVTLDAVPAFVELLTPLVEKKTDGK